MKRRRRTLREIAAGYPKYPSPDEQAMDIVRARARDLSAQTGEDPQAIADEIVRRQITPGDWAIEHGLNPITFEPTDHRPDGR